ncbi:MAG TPA: hypothetical protein VK914_00165 [bacterium]|jgi:hypothetical protein|nr:hypothetical protein [bacterium]
MRFFRVSYWFAFMVHLGLSGWLCLTPEMARMQLGDSTLPLIYLQEHGLFLFMQACAYGYVAERPAKSIPVVTLACIVNVCLPLFALSAYSRGELGTRHLAFQMAGSLIMLPFLAAYIAWFYHIPRPKNFMPLLGIFGERK